MPIETTHNRLRYNVKQVKVLVIEDSADHSVLMKSALQQCIPEVTAVFVDNSEEALELLNEWSTQEWELPKLIFQDLYLPSREDGWHLLEQIKTMSPSCNRVPVVMLSSSDDRTDIVDAYIRGVASYLVKPTDYADWLTYFKELRTYWIDTVTLPPVQFSI
ncbi:response regulator [Spirosoma endophyticum]|uniref:CheY chemotaxis protein or a CheY-like REC (Receiver) domain n=1 Tax=Spirosoma endophyticum TaxID=662367 RepID=A0A1I1N2N5_9BACT|nr:response regulator [Spirosoma endophyticum]SFC88060.1 CheY chemotaxis protein or a CheY-like REC (receiver) domain [Spirosoma endophyticum]